MIALPFDYLQNNTKLKPSVNTTVVKLFEKIHKIFQKTYKLNVYSIDSLTQKTYNSVMPLPFQLTILNVRSKVTFSILVKSFNFPLPLITRGQKTRHVDFPVKA